MDFTKKAELEQYFAENFDTVFFPILADIYKNEGDLSRARKVCEIGLEYHPNNIPGHFVLAEVYKIDGQLNEAEKFYKNILAIDPWHYRAAVNLAKIQTQLERAPESLAKLWRKILRINPTHNEAKAYLTQKDVDQDTDKKEPVKENRIEEAKEEKIVIEKKVEAIDSENIELEKSSEQIDKDVDALKQKLEIPGTDVEDEEKTNEPPPPEEILAPKPPSIKPQKISEDELQSLDITPRMATFTLVNVLKKQKLYQQSLYVLKMLEEKGADQALINQEKQAIKELIKQSESN